VVLIEQALPLEDAVVVEMVEIILAENVEIEMILIEMVLPVRGRDGECGRRDSWRRCADGRSRRDVRNRRRG